MTPEQMMDKIRATLKSKQEALETALKSSKSKQATLSITNELDFNRQVSSAFDTLTKGTTVRPSEFYFMSLNGVKGDYISKVLTDAVMDNTYKINRFNQIRQGKRKKFDYMEEVNKLSTDIIELKACRKWWKKCLTALEYFVNEDPSGC